MTSLMLIWFMMHIFVSSKKTARSKDRMYWNIGFLHFFGLVGLSSLAFLVIQRLVQGVSDVLFQNTVYSKQNIRDALYEASY